MPTTDPEWRTPKGSRPTDVNDSTLENQPFSFVQTRSGLVRIAYRGRVVTTLANREAARFLTRVGAASPAEQQLAMAKATGHFKHGNERAAKMKTSQ